MDISQLHWLQETQGMTAVDRSALFEKFVEVLPSYAVNLLDADGIILSWNAGACEILGYAADEIVGRHFSCLFTRDDMAAARPLRSLADALARGRHDETCSRVRKDGSQFVAHVILVPLYDPARTLLGFGSMTRDVASSMRAVLSSVDAPPAVAAPPTVAAPPAVAAPRSGREKILLVDDDEVVRGVTEEQLLSLGYRVISAANGAEALDMISHNTDISLLFTDVVMPGEMNGGKLAKAAKRVVPGLKVLFASGYFEGALVREGDIEASAAFIVKPYRKKDLAEKVEQVLGVETMAQ
jgi:PAS domain S-box-containing protein